MLSLRVAQLRQALSDYARSGARSCEVRHEMLPLPALVLLPRFHGRPTS